VFLWKKLPRQEKSRVEEKEEMVQKDSLRKSGNPLPVNDVWIGAHTLETGSVLVTYDRHFCAIPGLRLWDEL
jgi:predicted nucleic acid-binding protein